MQALRQPPDRAQVLCKAVEHVLALDGVALAQSIGRVERDESGRLMRDVAEGRIDPSFVITHKGTLADGPELYKTFRDKKDGCIKVVLRP